MKVIIVSCLLLLVYSLFLNLPYIHFKEFQGEEGRRVNVAVNMIKTGNLVVPYHEGAVYLRKPPLFNWLLAGMFGVSGDISEATARTVSVIAAFLCALILSLFWQKIARVKSVWFIIPGLIFLTFSDVMDKAIRAEIDMTFTLFVTLSLVSWFYFYEIAKKPLLSWIISLSFVSIGFLTKGVQSPVFFYSGVIPYLIYKREIKKNFSLHHLIGLVSAICIFLVWFVPLLDQVGLDRVIKVWWSEIEIRKAPVREGGVFRHFIEFPFLYLKAYLPWIPFVMLWIYKPLKGQNDVIKKLALFCFFCLAFSLPFYWLIPGARLRYIMPLAGMLSVLVAIPLSSVLRKNIEEPVWCRRYVHGFGALLILSVITSPFWGKRFELFDRISSIVLLGGVLVAAGMLLIERRSFRKKIILLLIAVLFAKVLWASFYFPYHKEHMSYYRRAADEINSLIPIDVAIYDYRVDNGHLSYYLKRPVRLISSFDKGIIGSSSAIYIMKKEDAEKLDLTGLSYIGEVEVRRMLLVIYMLMGLQS